MTKKSIVFLLVAAIMMLTVGTAGAQEAEPEELPSIVDIAVADDRFETLVTALSAAGLVDDLSGEGPFTVFAPTDDAFAKLPASLISDLLGAPGADLTDILTYHVVPGELTADEIFIGDNLTSLQGAAIPVQSVGGAPAVAGAIIQIVDIQASNGVIHVIDSVMLPPQTPPGAQAATVNILTSPVVTNDPSYVNFGGGATPIGVFDKYSWDADLDVSWVPVGFAEGTNGAYRIAIRQYDPTNYVFFEDLKVAFHWAENPNGTTFKFGAFGFGEGVFLGFPSYVVVQPQTFTAFVNAATGVTEYDYTAVEGAGEQWSDVFALIDPGQ